MVLVLESFLGIFFGHSETFVPIVFCVFEGYLVLLLIYVLLEFLLLFIKNCSQAANLHLGSSLLVEKPC